MADIDQIIAGGAKTNADFNFGKINDAYWAGKDQQFKNDERELFKGGVPKNADGSINYGAMRDALYQHGNLASGTALDNLDVQRQQLRLGQEVSSRMGALENGGSPPGQPSIVSPPSANRTASTSVAPPLARGGAEPGGQPQAAPRGGTTLMQVLEAQGIPNNQLGAAAASVGRQLGLEDPNAQIDINDPQVRNVLVPAVQQLKRAGIGQGVQQPIPPVQQPQGQPPMQQAQQQPAPTFNDRFGAANTRGLAPTENDPNIQQRAAQYTAIVANPALPESVRKAATMRLEALQKNSEMTGLQKEYAQAQRQGYKGTLQEYQDRTDDNTTQRDILTKSLLPKIDASQEKATAARDDISSIHRARNELDRPGGVFSGSFADKMKALAKVASAVGISDTSKITNTEAYGAAIGQRVASMVKAFGSGTAISDGDRKFAAAMAGGDIDLDERSMRRILDIGEKAARGKIGDHNVLVDKIVGANEGLKPARESYLVPAPGEYKKQEPASSFKDGQFAVNPKTKERIVYKGGKWVAAQ